MRPKIITNYDSLEIINRMYIYFYVEQTPHNTSLLLMSLT